MCAHSVTSVASDSVQRYRLLSLQATLPMGSWSGLPFPHPGDLPDPESRPSSPAAPVLQGDSLLLSHWGSPQHGYKCLKFYLKDIFKVLFTWEPNLSLPTDYIILIGWIFFFNFYFYFILPYNTVLVLPDIDMNPPRVYMSSNPEPPSHLLHYII